METELVFIKHCRVWRRKKKNQFDNYPIIIHIWRGEELLCMQKVLWNYNLYILQNVSDLYPRRGPPTCFAC